MARGLAQWMEEMALAKEGQRWSMQHGWMYVVLDGWWLPMQSTAAWTFPAHFGRIAVSLSRGVCWKGMKENRLALAWCFLLYGYYLNLCLCYSFACLALLFPLPIVFGCKPLRRDAMNKTFISHCRG